MAGNEYQGRVGTVRAGTMLFLTDHPFNFPKSERPTESYKEMFPDKLNMLLKANKSVYIRWTFEDTMEQFSNLMDPALPLR